MKPKKFTDIVADMVKMLGPKPEIKEMPASKWSSELKVDSSHEEWKKRVMGDFKTIAETRKELRIDDGTGFVGHRVLEIMTSRGPVKIDRHIDIPWAQIQTVISENEEIREAMSRRVGSTFKAIISADERALDPELVDRFKLDFIEAAERIFDSKTRYRRDVSIGGVPFDPKSVIMDEMMPEDLFKQIMDGPPEEKKPNPILKAIEEL